MPVLTVDARAGQPVYFEHHILLWKHPSVQIRIRPMKGALKRMIAGMQVFVTEASGPGQIAFSRDGAGHIFALHLGAGPGDRRPRAPVPRRHHGVDYTFERVKGVGDHAVRRHRLLHRPVSPPRSGEGILWLHGYGNVFEKTLAPGESIDVEPGGWLYKDPSVTMTTNRAEPQRPGFFGSMNFVATASPGPGRVGIQSMYLHMPTEE